jgi:uncharacterized protein (TIGR02145 family)
MKKLVLLMSVITIGFTMVTAISCKKSSSDSTSDSGPTVTDIDGNVYHTITIGTQTWIVENLRVRHYRNGDPLVNGSGIRSLAVTDTSGTFWAYENNTGYIPDYGLLYNYYAANDPRSIAPPGWHIPSDADYGALVNSLGGDYFNLPWGDTITGGKLKEAGNDHWGIQGDPRTNVGATNSTHWTGRPGGILYQGIFEDMRDYGAWWTTTSATGVQADQAYELVLSFNNKKASRGLNFKASGLSARCIKD